MKQTINIRREDDKPKIGSYQSLRNEINKKKIDRDSKKSVTSSTDPTKITTTKHINDQR